MKKTFYRNYFWRLTDEVGCSDSYRDIDTNMDTDTDRMHDGDSAAANGSQVYIGQGPRTCGILVVSILSLDVTVD
jgi:hypothetical protein